MQFHLLGLISRFLLQRKKKGHKHHVPNKNVLASMCAKKIAPCTAIDGTERLCCQAKI